MPTYDITAPDGRVYEVGAPDGASQADIMAYVRKQQGGEREKESGWEDFGEGLGVSGLETYYGIKDLFTDLDDEDRATLEDWRQDASQSGWGTAGQIGGEILQMAIPGGAALKGAKAVSKGINASKGLQAAVAAAANVGSAGGFGYARAPDIGETRGQNAADELTSALEGEVLGFGLGKAVKGINKTKEAQQLLDMGIDLTPGQATNNKMVRAAEGMAEVTPVIAPTVRKAKAKVEEQVREKALRMAAAPGKKTVKDGAEGVKELAEGFNAAYGDAWAGATSLSNEARSRFVDVAVNAAQEMPEAQRTAIKSILRDFKNLTANPTPKALKAMDKVLRKRLAAAGKSDYDLSETLTELRSTLRMGMPESVTTRLKAIDSKYPALLTVKQASKNAADEGGEFTARQLLAASKKVGKDTAGVGDAPLQRELSGPAARVSKRAEDPAPLETWRRLAGFGIPAPGAKTAGRAVLGETAPQKLVQPAYNVVSDVLRNYGVTGGTLGAINED